MSDGWLDLSVSPPSIPYLRFYLPKVGDRPHWGDVPSTFNLQPFNQITSSLPAYSEFGFRQALPDAQDNPLKGEERTWLLYSTMYNALCMGFVWEGCGRSVKDKRKESNRKVR